MHLKDFGGTVLTDEEGKRIAAALGNRLCCQL